MNFFSDFSLWWLMPWAVFSIGLSYLYYKNQSVLKDSSKSVKAVLMSLRAAALFLLGFLLLGLVFESKDYKTEKPVFITLVDNSSSMLNYKDSSSVMANIDGYMSSLKKAYGDRFDFVTYAVDDIVTDSVYDLKGNTSDLYLGFEHIFNQYYNRNIGGVNFISDGNFNKGNNPIYSAAKINLTPIFTLGVGDTIYKKDHLIKNVAVNDIAFYKNKFPVEVDIESRKIPAGGAKVSLMKEGKEIASEIVSYKGQDLEYHHVSFIVDATELGFVGYQIKLQHLDNESSYQNNQRSFYVEVIDSRNKVLILADAPHPDVSAVKQVLDKNQNMEVDSKLLKSWDGKLKDYALVVLHSTSSASKIEIVNSIEKARIPVWYILGGQTKSSDVAAYKIGLAYPKSGSLDEVQAYANEDFQLFNISEDLKAKLNKWPPVNVRFGDLKNNSGSVLLRQKVGPVKKDAPVLYFSSNGSRKQAVFIGEGLWKWRLDEFSKGKASTAYDELIQKTVQYLVVKKNTDPLRINLPKRMTISDELIINGEFYNASMEQITDPNISFKITNESARENSYFFAKGKNDYKLSLGTLAAGRYNWIASTTYNGKSHVKKGVFVVEEIEIETLETVANHGLLKTISSNSNGTFYNLNDYGNLIKEIGNREDIAPVGYTESSYNDLIDKLWLFILIILLLATEWFVRRYSGSY